MELINQLLKEYGADLSGAITLIPDFGAYLKGVRTVEGFSPEKITVTANKRRIAISGEGLTVEKYFQRDLFIRGRVEGVTVE